MTQVREQATMIRRMLLAAPLAVCLLLGVGCSRRPERETEQVDAAEDGTPGRTGRAEVRRDPASLLDLLPPGADVALAVADVNGLVEKALATSLADCLRDPAVAPLVDAIRKHEPAFVGIERYASFAPIALRCISGGAALAVRIRERGAPPGFAGVFEIAGRESDVAGLFGMLAGFGQMGGRVARSTVNGMHATIVAIPSPSVTVAWAQSDGLLYVADSAEGLRWLTTGAAEHANAARSRSHEESSDYALRIERPAATIAALAGMDLSALDAISRISVRGCVQRNVRENLRVEFERGGEVLAALSSAWLGNDLRARVPEHALVSLEVAFGDEAARHGLLDALLSTKHPAILALQPFITLSEQAALYYWSLGRIGWYPRTGAAFLIVDSDEVALGSFDCHSSVLFSKHRSILNSRNPDIEIRVRPILGLKGMVSYGALGGIAAFGSDPLAVREILSGRRMRGSTYDPETFARLEVDLAAIADRAVEPYLPALLEMLLPSFDNWFDRDLVPPGAFVGGYLGQIVARAQVSDGALALDVESPAGLAGPAFLALFAF